MDIITLINPVLDEIIFYTISLPHSISLNYKKLMNSQLSRIITESQCRMHYHFNVSCTNKSELFSSFGRLLVNFSFLHIHSLRWQTPCKPQFPTYSCHSQPFTLYIYIYIYITTPNFDI
jgi:hypothetical protein